MPAIYRAFNLGFLTGAKQNRRASECAGVTSRLAPVGGRRASVAPTFLRNVIPVIFLGVTFWQGGTTWGVRNAKREELERLECKTLDAQFRAVIQDGLNCSPFEAEEIIRLRVALFEIIASRSGKPIAQIEKDCDRNKWLDARETVAYGLADTILERMAPPK